MLNIYASNKKGDTLVEVLFAVAVFSLVAVGSLSIMNQGTATAQRALEITFVRQEIDAQAETLRFLNASYVAAFRSGITSYPGIPADEWHNIKAQATPTSSVLGRCTPPPMSFILNTRTAKFVPPIGQQNKPSGAKSFSQVFFDTNPASPNVITSVEGIWIEAIPSLPSVEPDESRIGYIDFHIRACWDSPGQSTPITLGTIVRLYEPR